MLGIPFQLNKTASLYNLPHFKDNIKNNVRVGFDWWIGLSDTQEPYKSFLLKGGLTQWSEPRATQWEEPRATTITSRGRRLDPNQGTSHWHLVGCLNQCRTVTAMCLPLSPFWRREPKVMLSLSGHYIVEGGQINSPNSSHVFRLRANILRDLHSYMALI